MKKVLSLVTFILLFAVLNACSNDEVTPEERLQEYVTLWNDQNFEQMYEMLSAETTEAYPAEQFIDRQQKIYEDLKIENLTVNFEVPEEETEAENEEEGSASFPVQVEMETIAGPVSFEREMELVEQETEEASNWFVNWDPGFIFPELENGADVSLERVQPERGEIVDRNQNGLAVNDTIYNVGVAAGELGENPEETMEELAEILAMDVETIETKLNASWVEPGLFVPLKKVPQTNEETEEALSELDGVIMRETTGRVYPYGEAAAHLTGYVGSITAEELEERDTGIYSQNDLIGKRGAELLYEERLKGTPGIRIVAVQGDQENQVIAETEVKHGEDIQLTIDAELQQTIHAAYTEKAGTAAVIQPKTGETLALVSSPAFDPNELAYGISQERLSELQENPDQPLLNRFTATFAPGSTIKPITAAIGLESGAIEPEETIEIPNNTWQASESWGDYRVRRVSSSDGPVDVTDALIRSDNIFFARQALDMGAETLVDGLHQFGFGEDLPFAYPIQDATISSSGELNSEVLLADTSYGQGQMETSAIHLAVAYTPLLNEGNLIKPVLATEEPTGEIWKEGIMSAENIEVIRSALRQVVTSPSGTANSIDLPDLALAGKTGTAELKTSLDDENGKENGWFVAYPEQEDLLIAMMMEDVGEDNGSHYVVDRAEEIFAEIR